MVNIGVIRNENGFVFRFSNIYIIIVEDTIFLGFNVIFLSVIDVDRVSVYLLYVLFDRVIVILFFYFKY